MFFLLQQNLELMYCIYYVNGNSTLALYPGEIFKFLRQVWFKEGWTYSLVKSFQLVESKRDIIAEVASRALGEWHILCMAVERSHNLSQNQQILYGLLRLKHCEKQEITSNKRRRSALGGCKPSNL